MNEDVEEDWLSFSFKLEADQAYISERKLALGAIVDERNNMIHVMLTGLDTGSIQSCRSISERLDEQSEGMRPEYENLHALVMEFLEDRRSAAAQLASELARNGIQS